MIVAETDTFLAERRGRFLRVELKGPHAVLSSCPVNGGLRGDIAFLVNHQSCEGRDDNRHCARVEAVGEAGYHEEVCAKLGVPAQRAALLGTAANMQYAACAGESDAGLCVHALVTAGVRGNAARAGDPAGWREDETGSVVPVAGQGDPPEGTIHILLLVNRPLSPGALGRCLATAVEAKAAVLQELAVPSLYGPGLATGTGTDGFALAAADIPGRRPLRFAGAHSKLGELTGRVVATALREALRWQNGLHPASTRNLFHALSRFGLREEELLRDLAAVMPETDFAVLQANREALWHEPQAAAAAYALASVLERAVQGTLPPAACGEALLNQLALMACAAAHNPVRFAEFRSALAGVSRAFDPADGEWKKSLASALALGWCAKWAEWKES